MSNSQRKNEENLPKCVTVPFGDLVSGWMLICINRVWVDSYLQDDGGDDERPDAGHHATVV